MSARVSDIMRTCYYHLRQIRSVRRSLTGDVARSLVQSLICSRLDYCNSLLFGISAKETKRLQSVLHAAGRLILRRGKHDHITDGLRDTLHWLPVRERIHFKICLMMFRCSRTQAPMYLVKYYLPISEVSSRRRLRSAACGLLQVPLNRTSSYGERSFSTVGPRCWNSVPVGIRDPTMTLSQFKSVLKTHLFHVTYY